LREYLGDRPGDIGLAYLDKRHEGTKISGTRIIGEVKDRLVIVVDDLISSGSTVREAVNAVETHEAELWGVEATHGLFVGKVNENLAKVNRLVVTDTITTTRLNEDIVNRTHYLSMAKLFAQAIRRTHQGESISKLL
jgi:ribose-phosphate pyrophosphokinase